MRGRDQTQNWRSHLGWLMGQLVVVFLGVSAAFIVDNYRENVSQREELRQVTAGLIAELQEYETDSVRLANGFDSAIAKWKAADREGKRAVPGYYRIPGSTHPPIATWTTAVNSGMPACSTRHCAAT